MKTSVLSPLTFNQSFTESEQPLKYKIAFLNSIFLLASVVSFGMGFYRWQLSPLMGAIDFGFSVVGLALLYQLKQHRDKVDLIGSICLVLAFIL